MPTTPAAEPQKPSAEAQMISPTYRLPALDQDFLLADPQRGVRFMQIGRAHV